MNPQQVHYIISHTFCVGLFFIPFSLHGHKRKDDIMARYKKRSDGRYATSITLGGEKYFLYATTQKDLEAKRRQLIADYEWNHLVKTSSMLFKDYCENWYHSNQSQRNANTRDMYYYSLYAHIIPELGHIPLDKITRSDIQSLINSLIDHPHTCQKIKNTLRQLFDEAIEDNLIYKNPCSRLKLPKIIVNDVPPFSDAENKAIQAAELLPEDRAFINVLLAFGCRRGEALALMRSDFDFTAQTVTFQRSITFDKNNPVINPYMKTKSSRRTLHIPKPFLDYFKTYVDNCTTLYLFTMQNGSLITKSSYTKKWNRILKAINQELYGDNPLAKNSGRKITAVVFRHDFCTKLYYSGISRKKAVEIMGHASYQMIEKVYAALDEKQEKSSEKIDAMFKNIM